MTFPSSIKVADISAKASEYEQYVDVWQTVADLFQGGSVLKDKVVKNGLYLLPKPKELPEVLAFRRLRFNYKNLIGQILGWYGVALFKTPAQLVKAVKAADGVQLDPAAVPVAIPKDAGDFCSTFEKDATRSGTTYADFWRKVFESLVLNKAAYILIDLPSLDPDDPVPASLAAQTAAGQLDPFLVLYTPSQVINWETDRYGNLEWCIIAVTNEEREAFQKPKTVDYWYYFDRDQVACYSAERKDTATQTQQQAQEKLATMVDGYPRKHAMSDLGRIPIRKVEVPDGLWLANRVFLPLLAHLNLDNAYDFALFQSALAMLVITGPYNDVLTNSEVGWINLADPAQKAFYLEPEGKAYKVIAERLESETEGIYKTCYLMDQARTNRSTPASQSGVSKQADKTPSRDALAGFGDVIRPAMQAVYEDVLEIRDLSEITPDVRGFDFQDRADAQDLQVSMQASAIDINSPTYQRERDKDFVQSRLPDANKETLAKIFAEIDKNPTPEEAAAILLEQQRADQIAKFSASFQGADASAA